MLLVFEIAFSVISWIDPIGSGWTGGGDVEGEGRWGAEGELRQLFGLKQLCYTFSM